MSISSTLASFDAPLAAAGATTAVSGAADTAVPARSRDHSQPGLQERSGPAGRDKLPDGFIAIRDARHLGMLGRWPLLEDGASPCLPRKLILLMRRRSELGDADAAAWLQIYARAYSGEVLAQRLFGRVCENGSFRVAADRQRAFFWYYRAALNGDAEAGMAAERLQRHTSISLAAMAAPQLVYPGAWRITAIAPVAPRSTSVFDLAENGAARGQRIGNGGVGTELLGNALSTFAAPFPQSLFSAVLRQVQYAGRWSYDDESRVLTLALAASVAGMPESRRDTWRIELLGCRTGALFGRDRGRVAYVIEPAPPADTPPA